MSGSKPQLTRDWLLPRLRSVPYLDASVQVTNRGHAWRRKLTDWGSERGFTDPILTISTLKYLPRVSKTE